jgi:uncharacterized delta-60 repeat protein
LVARVARVAIAAVVLNCLFVIEALAAPGDLDPTFGGDGIVYTTFFHPAQATGIALQDDGKIVVVGTSGRLDERFAVTRYLTDGTLDATFGGDGKVVTNITRRPDLAADVAIQADGRILVVGRSGGGGGKFGVVRYETDGSLDPSFGSDGIVATNFTPGDDIASAIALQADGRIVVAGTFREGFLADSRFAFTRYLSDGSLDASFDQDGKVTADFTAERDTASSVAIQPDGKIVAVGRAAGTGGRFALIRLQPDGSSDLTFGTSGKVMTNFTDDEDSAEDLALQPDGRIVVIGQGGGFFFHAYELARYTTDGVLDGTFAGDGRVRHNMPADLDVARAVALQADGSIIVSGLGVSTASSCETIAMVSRFTTTGALDVTFGDDGTSFTTFVEAQDAQDVVIQPDGAIVVAGAANFCGLKSTFAVLRYLPA